MAQKNRNRYKRPKKYKFRPDTEELCQFCEEKFVFKGDERNQHYYTCKKQHEKKVKETIEPGLPKKLRKKGEKKEAAR
ncbi:hypothetical protein CASFOL_037097 [Castilleja foliolosa]|uniref:Zinc finger protein n=1 Tax=Castilleja foliolosa TaxID=1961234 RepID=A0ABD3BQJ5_9LAMI